MSDERMQNEQDLNELLRVKRAKLAELQEKGKDPFKIMKYDVTHHSSDITGDYGGIRKAKPYRLPAG